MTTPDTRKALAHLRRVDPVMAGIIKRVGPCRLDRHVGHTHFHDLTRSIVFQQLSGRAADTILGRFVALFPRKHVDPELLVTFDDEQLRACGLSRQKIGYLRDFAAKVNSGAVPLTRVRTMSDDDIIEHLVQVKGIGRWTAQMFLMFKLGRPDVLPELDLGIQKAIQRAYNRKRRVTPKDVRRIGAVWSPYATVACWYLWRSLETEA